MARASSRCLSADTADTARHDLAALRNVALQQAHVLVVDLRRIGAGERACLAPAKERAPCPAAPAAEFTAAVSTFEAHGVSAPLFRYLLRSRDPPAGRA